ncbi:hypothetical protein MW290_15450 [Aquincola tertiaricarbonis]|uniref:Uncharacterized protein n=1 Tax=Aquincola tertiaricarbonis TaxID=391953 RepID=A0ABY4SGR9_AQUTE|nr:hypothetical protein [Aquincola tertiaricarbonis]URI10409.1 hypothetical protein MW290_15450 [Aquincola tertiaricarbonis]
MTLPTAGPDAARPPVTPVVPRGPQVPSARREAQPTQPRVLQSPRAPGQMSFVFRRPA